MACWAFCVFGFWDPITWLMREYPVADPLLFTEDWQPKPAYFALQEALAAADANA